MAKDNEFVEQLKKSVVEASPSADSLEQRRETLVRELEELEGNVIRDPKAIENLKKEIAAVDKEIESKKNEEVKKGAVTVGAVDVAQVEQDEQSQQTKKKEPLTTEEKEKMEAAKKAYYDAMIALHEKRLQTIEKQKAERQLVSSNEDYEEELNLEAKLYEARNYYLEFGEEDPYTEKRTELIKKEKEAREPIELELRNRAKRFKEIEQEINKIDKREQEINEELLKEDISEGQIKALQDEMGELGQRRKKLELELSEIKDQLDKAIETRRARVAQRAGLEQQHIETLSSEDKKNYDYQQSKIATMNQNFDQATKQHYDNVKRRIEERERKIKAINKELKEVPSTDFERRLVLLNELDKETNMLEADREAKSDLDRGIVPESVEMARDAEEKADSEAFRQKEFDKSTDEARAVVEEQKKAIGETVADNPGLANIEEQSRAATHTAAAATVAIAVDSPAPGPDTPLQNVAQFAVARCVISGLEDKVRDPNNPEDAKAIVENDEQITKANEELQKVQENIERQTQR